MMSDRTFGEPRPERMRLAKRVPTRQQTHLHPRSSSAQVANCDLQASRIPFRRADSQRSSLMDAQGRPGRRCRVAARPLLAAGLPPTPAIRSWGA